MEMDDEKNDSVEMPINREKYHLIPLDKISGYDVRPGFYDINGATAIPGGISFTVHSFGATGCELLLFERDNDNPFAILPFPEHYKIGQVYSMIVFGISIYNLEYAYRVDGPMQPEKGLIFNKEKILLDPYAKSVTGQSEWGTRLSSNKFYKARVVREDYDWKDFIQPLLPVEDLIIYELHVRGYTKDESSGVRYPGTFAALKEKIPYLKKLGINAVELMPIFEFDEALDLREYNGNTLCDYWGYNPVSFFAPNASYIANKNEFQKESNELKDMIMALNENGIEVILDVVFNHTAEGNEGGRYISFKGFDNNIYYLLTPEGFYYNFSGCGNTLNCNNPIVQQMILECLRYWVIAYRVDGFRFDLASILGRNEDGSPMNQPPLLQSLAYDPILGKVKLIAEAWDAGGLYQVGRFPSWNNRWAEWNGKYRDDIRRFLKGDQGMANDAAKRIAGSLDLYHPDTRQNASINFITCHDGFTLYDLYSYNEKHNEENGWNNTDGGNDNYSWNCGAEGETDSLEIIKFRKKMIRNAFAVLFSSRGTPMFFAGDEFGNTQFGNNNPYCQDNKTSWLNWDLLKQNQDIFEFVVEMIKFRRQHSVLRRSMATCSIGFPDISFHGIEPWVDEFHYFDNYVGVMFAGRDTKKDLKDDIVYIAMNTYWEDLDVRLPQLPVGLLWRVSICTDEECKKGICVSKERVYQVKARTVTIFTVTTMFDSTL